MAEPADINVDELRRRARRRLVGAIVLALGAAVIVPMLLESEPRPLGEDVAVRIPPVDDGKFVNRLNDSPGKGSGAAPGAVAPPKDSKPPAAAERPSVLAASDKAIATAGNGKADGAFAVQLAAFSDDKGANALAGKLKRAGYNAYTEPLKTSKGTLWRVRVGPYGSRDAATV